MKQISIKLNRKFESLIQFLQDKRALGHSDSETVGFALWYLHLVITAKLPNGMTREEVILDLKKQTRFKAYVEVFNEFKRFLSE